MTEQRGISCARAVMCHHRRACRLDRLSDPAYAPPCTVLAACRELAEAIRKLNRDIGEAQALRQLRECVRRTLGKQP